MLRRSCAHATQVALCNSKRQKLENTQIGNIPPHTLRRREEVAAAGTTDPPPDNERQQAAADSGELWLWQGERWVSSAPSWLAKSPFPMPRTWRVESPIFWVSSLMVA